MAAFIVGEEESGGELGIPQKRSKTIQFNPIVKFPYKVNDLARSMPLANV